MNPEDPAPARTQEKIYLWLFIGTLVLYGLSLFAEWVHLNLAALIAITVGILIILFFVVREKPTFSFADALKACADVQYALDGESLPLNIRDAEVICDIDPWEVFFWKSGDHGWPVLYRVDPHKRAVIGRELNDHEAVIARIERNQVLSSLLEERLRKKQQRAAAEKAGVEVEDEQE